MLGLFPVWPRSQVWLKACRCKRQLYSFIPWYPPPIILFSFLYFFWHEKTFRAYFVFPVPQPWNRPSIHRTLGRFSREWCLETKVQVLGMLIASGVSRSQCRSRTCMYIYMYVQIGMCARTYLHIHVLKFIFVSLSLSLLKTLNSFPILWSSF